jgi:hypothetical protein
MPFRSGIKFTPPALEFEVKKISEKILKCCFLILISDMHIIIITHYTIGNE